MNDLILSVEDAYVLIGGKPFFEKLTFHIHQGRKIALVGKNGAGKTTLMNMITGAKELDGGRRWLSAGTSIGYMQQQIQPTPGQTVREFVFSGTNANADEWEQTYKVEMIIEPLGLRPEDQMDKLSGGLLRRAALAHALVEEPDILLLDEPTNHMDLETVQWLEEYLKYYRGAVVCVSHDRTFLANITDRVFWLDRGRLRVSPRGFASFEEWSHELIEEERRQLHNREKKVELEMAWATRGVKARVKRNVRRASLAHEEKAKFEADQKSFRKATATIKVPIVELEESSFNVAEFMQVNKSFVDDTGHTKVILDKFNLRIKRRERIGIIGKNGCGKTTFLKMLIGEEKHDTGKVKIARDLEFGYFDQKRSGIDPDKTIQENLCGPNNDHLDVRGKWRHVCGYLKDFMFEPADAWRRARTLSGGQMNRLLLAKVLANPGSFLILDEPTNDLDMDTLDMLEIILENYDGTLVVVSHDRDFMDQIVDKLLVFDGNGKVDVVIGGYSDYLETLKEKKPKPVSVVAPEKKKEEKQQAAPKPKDSSGKLSYNLQHELERLPKKIQKYEDELSGLEEKMADPDFYAQNPDAFFASSKRIAELRLFIDESETRWLELENMRREAHGG